MADQPGANTLIQVVPFLLFSAILGVVANLLAREKGRRVLIWTVLGAVPVVNFVCIWFFIGAANLRLERKVDELLQKYGHV